MPACLWYLQQNIFTKKDTFTTKDFRILSVTLKKLRPYFFISLAGIALYAHTLSFQSTYHDDYSLTTKRYSFYSQKNSVLEIFKQSVFEGTGPQQDYYYRPLLSLSFLIDAYIGGDSPAINHVSNLFYHLFHSLLLFYFLKLFLQNSELAFWLALIFVIHPATVQAVAWVPGRNDILLSIFSLLSFIFLHKYLHKKNRSFLLLHNLFFAGALLTKESAAIFPLFFILYCFLSDKPRLKIKKEIILFGIWGVIVLAYFILRISILGVTIGLPLSYSLKHFFLNTPAYLIYLGKVLLPFDLSTFPTLMDSSLVYGAITLTVVILSLKYSREVNFRKILLGSVWFIAFLIPAIIPTSDSFEAGFLEHRLYFPILGFCIVINEISFIKNVTSAGKYVFAGIGAVYFYLSFIHTKHYENEYSYHLNGVTSSPHSSFMQRGMGTYFLVKKNYVKAEKHYKEALRLNPEINAVRNNLGRIYLIEGDTSKAELFFREETELSPEPTMALYNLGVIHLSRNNLDSAEIYLIHSLKLDSSVSDVSHDLAIVYGYRKNYEKAVGIFLKILDKEPEHYSAKRNLELILSVWNDSLKTDSLKALLSERKIIL